MGKERTNSDNFLIIYNELDKYMRDYLKEGTETPHSHLIRKMSEKNKVFRRNKDLLYTYANLRNAIVHNPDKRDSDPIAEPHDNTIKKYNQIKEFVMNPPKALETVAIPFQDIYTTTLTSRALDLMGIMERRLYSHIPVIDNGKMVGIFSENTVFSYITKNKDSLILEADLVSKFEDFIGVERNESEYYAFVKKDALLVDIEEMFQHGIKNNKRLAVAFITENGKQNEKLLGLITVWDLVIYKE